MSIVVGTDEGVWVVRGDASDRIGLASKRVSHVATRGGVNLATVPRDGLYQVGTSGEPRLWEGDARSCAIGPDGTFFVGTEPDGTFLNAEIIKQGYGFAYTRFPFKYMDEFRRYEREAREKHRGLWGKSK